MQFEITSTLSWYALYELLATEKTKQVYRKSLEKNNNNKFCSSL